MTENKLQQVLQIDPPRELVFTGPFTDVVNSTLNLKNPSEKLVCFKVRTTAPNQYCVRPNSGIIHPGQNRQITFMLQPLDGANTAEIGRHKFMVQTCFAPPGQVDLESIWKTLDQNELMYSKLMAMFENPRTTTTNQFAREEVPATIQYNSPSVSIPSKPNNEAPRDLSIDSQLRNEVELRKKIENEKAVLTKEVQELFKKNAELQQTLAIIENPQTTTTNQFARSLTTFRDISQPDFTTKWGNRCDIAIKTQNSETLLYANKSILAVHSSFFEALFFGGFKESKQDTVEVNVDFEVFLEILKILHHVGRNCRFLERNFYCIRLAVGTLENKVYSVTELVALYQAAELLDISLIQELYQQHIDQLPIKDAFEIALELGLHKEKPRILKKMDFEDIKRYLKKGGDNPVFSSKDVDFIVQKTVDDYQVACSNCKDTKEITFRAFYCGHYKKNFTWHPKNC